MPAVKNPETDRRLKANRYEKANIRTSVLLARARGATPIETEEPYETDETKDSGIRATVARSGYGTLPVYKLTPSGCTRIEVAVQGIEAVLMQRGYAAECFDCHSDKCNGEPNGCPGRPKKVFRVCPVLSCGKHIYDAKPTGAYLTDEFDHSDRPQEEGMIDDGRYSQSTPESRTAAQMDYHLWGYHETEAAGMGITMPSWKKAEA